MLYLILKILLWALAIFISFGILSTLLCKLTSEKGEVFTVRDMLMLMLFGPIGFVMILWETKKDTIGKFLDKRLW